MIIYLIFIYKKTSLFKIGVFLCLLIILSSLRYYIKFPTNEFYGTVIEAKEDKATVISKGMKILIYHDNELSLGDYGYFKVSDVNYDSDLFNYGEYLINKDIKKITGKNNLDSFIKMGSFKKTR